MILPLGRKNGRPSAIMLGDRARDAGDWHAAARHYRTALERNPARAPIWVQYGHALKESGFLAQAEAAYRRALAEAPKVADTYLQLGHVLKLQGRAKEAEAAYLRALVLHPALPDVPEELRGLGWSETAVQELQLQVAPAPPTPERGPGSRKPWSGRFDAEWYLQRYPDVARAGIDPLVHFVSHGMRERRAPNANEVSVGPFRPVTDATIRCLKRPACRGEIALFVTHSPHGRLKPHVRHYLDSLKRQGIAVIVIVAADVPFTAADAELLDAIDGLFVRDNQGYDFAAWAHVLRLHPELYDAKILYLLNDSVFGPTNDAAFAAVLEKVRTSSADLVGLTDNYEYAWHLQSYFLALKERAASSRAFREFVQGIVSYNDKLDVIRQFEFRLTSRLRDAGMSCIALFVASDDFNPSVADWRQLLERGFPFLKVEVARDSGADTSGWREALAAKGYDVRLAENALVELASSAISNREAPSGTAASPEPGDAFAVANDELLRLQIDRPALVNSRANEIVRGRLQIVGWALARGGVEAIDVSIDGQPHGSATYGIRREDVARAYPHWKNSQLSGFAWVIPTGLDNGDHRVSVTVRSRTGQSRSADFDITFTSEELTVETLRRKMPRSEIDLNENILAGLEWRPFFAILVCADGSLDDATLERTFQSLREQAYRNWHVVVLDRRSRDATGLETLLSSKFGDLTDRVTVIPAPGSEALVETITRATGGRGPDLIGVVSAGDVLACDALLQLAVSTGIDRDADFFYTDERRLSPVSGKPEAFFKPQWSPDLLLATNYIGRFWCARPDLLDRVGARLADWSEFGEYDLVLRLTEAAQRVLHVPHLLCERGAAHLDVPAAERRALTRALQRRGGEGDVLAGCAPGYYRLRRHSQYRGLVSIIMPTGGNVSLIGKCLPGLFDRTTYQNFELIILHNTSTKPEVFPYLETVARDPRVKIIDSKGPFNFSRICNLGAAAARGEMLLFLNDDIEVIEPDWIEAMIQHAERPEVGIVGARLLYPDGTVQHAGIFWLPGEGGGRHSFRFAAGSDPGYFGLAMTTRNVLAVTGACIMMRKSWFETIGRFDETHTIVNNDVDICLRSWSHGGRVIYEPAAALIHHETATRHDLPDEYDVDGFWTRWGDLIAAGDPYYHPNLSRGGDIYSVEQEPVQLSYAGHPLFSNDDIHRILIVKLDHIGDFITAVPAINRLQSYFPDAEIYLLAPPASAGLAGLVPGIREVIPFEFFHPRSQFGQREVSEEDMEVLRRRLVPYRFDLAIDLRQDPATRNILLLSGARWLAGYDRDCRFSWLDITLEREEDFAEESKRVQIGDELCRLIDAVGLAANRKRRMLSLADASPPPRVARPGRRLVCIHPGVGTQTRQWPVRHFAALIDLLISNHDLDVALVGGADEADIAREVLDNVKHKEAVHSLIGKTKLADLPALLSSAALFVGNNSGPNHIAAGLGVPTVGVYSGTVDARQWGAIGPNAVAVQRRMHCSPCYFATVDQCPRNMACVTELHPSAVYEVCKKLLWAKCSA